MGQKTSFFQFEGSPLKVLEKLAFFSLLFSLLPLYAQSSHLTGIPLDGRGIPANDLVYEGEVLTSEEAWQVREKVSLYTLDPTDSEIWKKGPLGAHDYDPFEQVKDLISRLDRKREQLNFQSSIQSHSGLLRFNASHPEFNERVMTVHMDKSLHTFLLRKNLLEKLGYQLPPVKYLEQVEITFDSVEQRDHFLTRTLPQQTLASSQRWVVKKDETTVLFQDVAITIPSENDHYNVAMGVPPEYLSNRALRALIVPYALLDLDESVNKFNWFVGQQRNKEIVLPHFVPADFATTLDDALWILERLKKLSRADFQEVVQNSYFPRGVENLVTEKIVARRNFLMDLFGVQAKELAFDSEISYGSLLEQGRLIQEDYEGYASRFAHGVPDSPFDGFGYSVLAELQSITINEIISRVNRELSLFDLNEARGDFLVNQFEQGLEDFVQSGEFSEQNLGTWVSPVLNGQLVVSRDIVVGPYLGTDNLVQMADTFGYGARLGAHAGFDSIDSRFGGSLRGSLHYIKTFSHITPVKTLKDSLKEPYKNIYVPYLKRKLEETMGHIGELDLNDHDEDELDEYLEKFAEDINDRLGVGESLIITERLGPEVQASVNWSSLNTRTSANAGIQGNIIKRTHLYRKDNETLQVYVDHGQSKRFNLAFRLDYYIPVLELRYSRQGGDYQIESYQVNIENDLEENPKLPESALALASLLENGSSELLQEVYSPYEVDNDFLDQSTNISILHWRHKALMKSGEYEVKTPQNFTNRFLQVTKAEQSGVNYRDFAIDIVNYYLGQYLEGIQIASNRWQNPGQTLFGMSRTRSGRFESFLGADDLDSEPTPRSMSELFLNIQYLFEGWRGSRDKIIKRMLEFNEKIGRDIFSEDFIRDVVSMRLYNLEMNINIYEKGVQRLQYLENQDIQQLERRYTRRHAFERKCREIRYRNTSECGNLRFIREKNTSCKRLKGKSSSRKYGRCLLDLALMLEETLDFDDFLKIIGEDNVYVYGRLNGFRQNNEILLKPIESNTLGQIQSKFWNGPLEYMRQLSGIQPGEFHGTWMRDRL